MDRAAFYQKLRASKPGPFRGSLTQEQVEGVEGILDAMAAVGDGRAKTLAYALATAYHETGRRMIPVREGFARTDADAIHAVAALARRIGPGSAPERYGKPAGPYGHCYYGRGHVQLTWEKNYVASSADAGVDLEREPDRMLDPVISARILIRGLIDGRWNGHGKGLAAYLPSDGSDNLKDARRTVNGLDKWDTIAGYYQAFLAAIEAAGGWCAAPPETAKPADEITQPQAAPVAAASLSDWLGACPGDVRTIGAWLAAMPGPDNAPPPVRVLAGQST